METKKAHESRFEEGFFSLFCQGKGIDIGVGRLAVKGGEDPVTPDCLGWDKDNGDATFMKGVPDKSFDFVHSSHCIEHLDNPVMAVMNWWRILKPGGHMIILAPHRDLYEGRKTLPSHWNHTHKFFLLPDRSEPPHTLSLMGIVEAALSGQEFMIPILRVRDGDRVEVPPDQHPIGEYSIEIVVWKPGP